MVSMPASGVRTVDARRSLLIVVAAVLFMVGWLAGAVWLAAQWCAAAVRVGWDEARESGRVVKRGR